MSGVVGIVNLDGMPIDHDLLWQMTDFMSFRGPDAQEVWIDGNVGLGHTMLRTTLETKREKQPLTLDGNVWLTADARIDKRRELIEKLEGKLGSSLNPNPNDAELILRAYEVWAEDCVNYLVGDFAFAIWDSRARRLFCARDHFGVKPFFFARVSKSFIFSNTLNALRHDAGVSDALNEVAIGDYLLSGLNQDLSTTIFRDIQRLPPAHTLILSDDSITTRRYWSPVISNPIQFNDRQSYVERFTELLTSATDDRLRTDRVSVSMSGGLDSTSLAAIASDLVNHNVQACAIVYDTLIPDEERYYSTAAAKHLSLPITHLNADRYSLYDARQPGNMDQPEPFLLSALTGQFNDLMGICANYGRVALTGYDGDSLMNEPARSFFVSSAKRTHLAELVKGLSWYVSTQKRLPPLGVRAWISRILGRGDGESFYPEWIDESFAARINLRERCDESCHPQGSKGAKQASPNDLIETRPSAFHALHSKVWAPLFEGYDPGSTRLPLEVRHPFMDLRVVEYLLAIPAVPWCVNKHVLRVAMKDRLPAAVLNRSKTPLAGDPALQLVRHTDVRWLDSFEVNPQLKNFVNLDLRRSIADEKTTAGLWASLRVFALNYWLTNSQRIDRRTTITNRVHDTGTSIAQTA